MKYFSAFLFALALLCSGSTFAEIKEVQDSRAEKAFEKILLSQKPGIKASFCLKDCGISASVLDLLEIEAWPMVLSIATKESLHGFSASEKELLISVLEQDLLGRVIKNTANRKFNLLDEEKMMAEVCSKVDKKINELQRAEIASICKFKK